MALALPLVSRALAVLAAALLVRAALLATAEQEDFPAEVVGVEVWLAQAARQALAARVVAVS